MPAESPSSTVTSQSVLECRSTFPRHRPIGVVLLAALACGTTALGAPGAVAADSPALHTHDVITVGMPDLDRFGANGAGAVDEFLTDGGALALNEHKAGLVTEDEGSFARFGAAVVRADVNSDGYTDLLIGVPGLPSQNVPGKVDLLFGTALGVTGAGARTLTAGGADTAGDEFGTAIAVTSQADNSQTRDLWIGAPGREVGGHADAGAIHRFSINQSGQTTLLSTITQSSGLVPGTAEAGDRFGEVLAPAGNGVVVGVPHEDVGTAKDAGAVQRLRTAVTGNAMIAAVSFDQNSPGVGGGAEAGDRFGAAVSSYGFAVGAPGEDVGTRKDAGSVQLFTHAPTVDNSLVPAGSLTQGSPGIPGSIEAGDRFGAALGSGVLNCQEVYSVAVGAPGEDLGKATDAGSVTITALPLTGNPSCPTIVLSEGKRLPGAPEAGDGLGTALATATGDLDLEEDRFDTLLIGVPGEDVGTTTAGRDTGRALTWSAFRTQTFGRIGGDRAGLRYGSVLGTEAK